MSTRAVLPGALIAAMLTGAALLALLVALGIRGEGPFAFGIGDSDGSARLDGGGAATLAEPTPGVRETTPVVLPGGSVAAPAAGAPARRGTAVRGATDGRQQAGRRPAARTPARGVPVVSPTRPTTNAPAGGPVATSTPNPNPVKVRSREPSAPKQVVKKQRVTPGSSATPAPVPTQPVPAPTAPQLNRSAPPAPTPASTPVVTRVPAPTVTP
jgi:hypothetical protein